MTDQTPSVIPILETTSLAHLGSVLAIEQFGQWVDVSWDARRPDALTHLSKLADTINLDDVLDSDRTLLNFYLGNLWNGLKFLADSLSGGSWNWEQIEVEKEIVYVRRALQSPGLPQLPPFRHCQLLTNLGNCYSTTGRYVEAVDVWNDAIAIEPRFGMARGNRAVGLWTYARSAYDQGHATVMARQAWLDLAPKSLESLEPGAGQYFAATRAEIETALPPDVLNQEFDLDRFPLGDSEGEIKYRGWCLEHRLFLNPLNDIGPINIAAIDVLSSPSIVAKIGEGPRFHDYFNQIKQEYCSARWLVFESTHDIDPHFSDREVLLFNTLDYPSYGLGTEKLKLAFRALYSLFDKTAFFLNAYMDLGIPEKKVSFRGLWFKNQNRSNGIRDEFSCRENWPLRGLYWLGKDLYEDTAGFREVMDPAAERLNEIRNHLEHKYLKLHSDLWGGAGSSTFTDGLAVSLSREEFEAMTMRLLRMTRAAIIYLSLGVHREERVRATERGPNAITPPMFLDKWEDDWKS
ncbi:MAG: hypothetical protein H6813_02645 [Phycisphaeraceae bacterium]|nr:hypothetical protein [Phycisphaeraceae bacterium]MCB9848785.1 hypothetical protein [Phycisphaeraceae bacterium]